MRKIRTLPQLLEALSHGYKIPCNQNKSKPLSGSASLQEKDERHFCVSLAGRVIAIDSLYSEVYSLCGDYLCDGEPEIRISIQKSDIDYERSEAEPTNKYLKESYLETLAVYRKISEAMLDFNTFLMHGAVVAAQQKAFMFTAVSGTGKTTHIKKWLEHGDDIAVVNGDKPLIKVTDSEAYACGTPWCGKENWNTNRIVPLRAIVLMERAEGNSIQEISFRDAFAFLLQQTYHPKDEKLNLETLKLISMLQKHIHFYRFMFNNMKNDTFEVAYNMLTGNS